MSERAIVFVFPPRESAHRTWEGWHGWRAVILLSSSGVACEDDNAGDAHEAAEVGLRPPFEPGLWVWRGKIRYPDLDVEPDKGAEFVGEWRRPTALELAELAGPVERAPSLRPPES